MELTQSRQRIDGRSVIAVTVLRDGVSLTTIDVRLYQGTFRPSAIYASLVTRGIITETKGVEFVMLTRGQYFVVVESPLPTPTIIPVQTEQGEFIQITIDYHTQEVSPHVISIPYDHV